MYWFYILKGFKETDDFLDTINLITDVFIADNREEAKKYISSLHPDTPYRKPKNPTIDTKYIYLTESYRYWYDRQYKEVEITCNGCMQTKVIVGTKNIHLFQNNEYCSEECREEAKNEYYQEYISEDDHVGLARYKHEEVTGYIYRITNKRTMKCYVGQTIKPALFRWWQHLKIEKKFEQMDISELVFEVLEVVTYNSNTDNLYANAKDKLNKREAFYISLFNSVEEGYNEVQPKEVEYDLFTVSN